MGKRLDTDYALYAYNQGWTDAEIAERVGSNVRAVKRWRDLTGLEENVKEDTSLSKLERDAIAAKKAGLSYGQYKARGGVLTRMKEKEKMKKKRTCDVCGYDAEKAYMTLEGKVLCEYCLRDWIEEAIELNGIKDAAKRYGVKELR